MPMEQTLREPTAFARATKKFSTQSNSPVSLFPSTVDTTTTTLISFATQATRKIAELVSAPALLELFLTLPADAHALEVTIWMATLARSPFPAQLARLGTPSPWPASAIPEDKTSLMANARPVVRIAFTRLLPRNASATLDSTSSEASASFVILEPSTMVPTAPAI